MAVRKSIMQLCALLFCYAPVLAQDVPSQAMCRPGDTDPRCRQQSDPDLDGDKEPYAGPRPAPPDRSGNGSGTRPLPPPPLEPVAPPPLKPWHPPPPPTAAQIRNILDAPVKRLRFVDLDHVADDIRIIMQYHMRSLGSFEQRELLDKLHEVEMEKDFRTRNRPPPPPGPPPPPPPSLPPY